MLHLQLAVRQSSLYLFDRWSIKRYCITVKVGIAPKKSVQCQNSAFENHPREYSSKYTKHLQVARYRILKITKSHLTASLVPVERLEAKQSSAQPPFYATITNSPVGCAFQSSNKCRPAAPCLLFIFNQAVHILLHPMNP